MKAPAFPDKLLGAVRMALTATTPEAAIAELVSALPAMPPVRDPARLRDDALVREREGSTWLGRGLALPHARTDAVGSIVVAAGRSVNGISWGGPGEIAHLVVFVGVPKAKVRDYLEFVRRLTVAMRDETRARALLTAEDAVGFRNAWHLAMLT